MDFMQTGFNILEILNLDYGYFFQQPLEFIFPLSYSNTLLYVISFVHVVS
jgi:hypothetical protein